MSEDLPEFIAEQDGENVFLNGDDTRIYGKSREIAAWVEIMHPTGAIVHWNIGPKRREIAKELLAKNP